MFRLFGELESACFYTDNPCIYPVAYQFYILSALRCVFFAFLCCYCFFSRHYSDLVVKFLLVSAFFLRVRLYCKQMSGILSRQVFSTT